METKELICIGCPLGCALQVTVEGTKLSVTGNTCKRGETYGMEEMTRPTRMVTSTVLVRGGTIPMVSVKTDQPIPKGSIWMCIKEIKELVITAPVSMGQILCHKVAGTDANIVATKEVTKQDEPK